MFRRGTYDTVRDVCYVDYDIECPDGMTYNAGLADCASPAGCPSGTLDPDENLCYTTYTPECAAGTTYDSVANKCVSDYSCGTGILDTERDLCWQNVPEPCPEGYYTADSDLCMSDPECSYPGTYSEDDDLCLTPNEGWTCDDGYIYDSSIGKCKAASSCLDSGVLNTTTDVCQKVNGFDCDDGYTLVGDVCQIAATGDCPTTDDGSAAYDAAISACSITENSPCGEFDVDYENDACYDFVRCTDGALNADTDRCEAILGDYCPSGFVLNTTTLVCEKQPLCVSGLTYSTEVGACVQENTTALCADPYVYSASLGACVMTPLCEGGTFNEAYGRCEIDPGAYCPDGMSADWDTMLCSGIPDCPEGALGLRIWAFVLQTTAIFAR